MTSECFIRRSDTIESVLCGLLFPTEFSIKDKVQHWVRVFSGFDKVEIKALEKILEQKQRYDANSCLSRLQHLISLPDFYLWSLMNYKLIFRRFLLGLQVTARDAEVSVAQADVSGSQTVKK